jgi:Na+/melibiose symporter-like transporter
VFAWLQGLIVVGVLLALALPAILDNLPDARRGDGLRAMGWLAIGLTPLTLGLAFISAREPRERTLHSQAGLKEYGMLLKNRTVLRLLAMDISIQTAAQIAGVLFFFYVEQVKHFSSAQAGLLLLAYFTGALCATPLWHLLAAWRGKHRALAAAAGFFIIAQGAALMMPPGRLLIGMGVMALAGVPYSSAGVLVRAMLADLGDQQRLDTGADRVSLFYALQIGDSKLAAAFAVGAAFPLLSLVGFNPASGAANTPQALLGLLLLFIAAPSVLGLVSAWLALGYGLTAERHAQISAALAERDAHDVLQV